MAISVQCGECFETIRVRDELAGKKVRCKSCGATIVVERPTSKKTARRDDDEEFDDTPVAESPTMTRRKANKKKTRGKLAAWWSSLDFADQETQVMLLTGVVTIPLCFLTLIAFLNSRGSLMLYGAGLYLGIPTAIAVGMYGTALQFNISFANAAFRWIICLGIGFVVTKVVDHFQLPRGITRGIGVLLYFSFQPTVTRAEFRKRFPLYNRCFAVSLIILFLPRDSRALRPRDARPAFDGRDRKLDSPSGTKKIADGWHDLTMGKVVGVDGESPRPARCSGGVSQAEHFTTSLPRRPRESSSLLAGFALRSQS